MQGKERERKAIGKVAQWKEWREGMKRVKGFKWEMQTE